MQAHRVGQSLGLVAGTAAALVLVVGFVSTAHAQDCNGALNITIPSPMAVPPTGPYLNVGDSTTVKLNLGSGTISGGTQITLRHLRYELDCNHLFALGVPCTDQGTIMSYDFTQTVASGGALVQCQGRTWTATAGGSANEVVFTPDTPIVLPPEQSASPTLNNCFISFQVKLENLESTSGPDADDTPQKVEVVAGFSTVIANGHADAECDNGGASGVSQSSGIFICPNCTVDQCNLGCDTTTGTCTPQQVSTPCGDTDGNTCTTAGCELSAGLGVCVQTHLFAENSTPCTDTDGNACTTAGCNGQGVCDQNHSAKVCPPADECNQGCDTTSGQCTPQASTPCTDSDGNTCTTAGCEVSGTNPELGVCVQTHMFASNSTPCADSDGNACTTAGCNGQGVCDQNHSSKVCPGADECNGGCDTTSGLCTPQASTPCTDTDGNTCTTAGCEISTTNAELGVCVQTHLFASNSTPCADSDGNACTTAGCNGQGVCDQNHGSKVCPPADQCNKGCDTTSGLCTPQASTPCTDTDGNTCTTAGCEVSGTNPELGVCVQTHLFAENSTPCADSDGNACTTAGCNGQGVCDQNHGSKVCPPADQCNKGCDTTSGKCTPQASTPCTDTDGNTCTTAGCEISTTNADLGVCVQTHLFASNSTPCADTDNNACTTAGCNGQGVCDQNHSSKVCPPADQCNKGCDTTSGQCTPQTSTPCTDTDGNVCTTAGCEISGSNPELGVCVQTHMFASNSTPCPDTDNDACTTAGCNGQGVCDQSHLQCVKALGCRVTGGGTVDACGPGDSGCDPNTPGSCAPDTCASPALEATHGGQVGAPVGVATAFTADSACIAGEWTHVRHIRPRLFGNFHARSFDSLMCACLPCPENPDVEGVVGALCNPDDRICGPEPRRAPANKICFSGAGDYALTNGRRESRSVVFRVDVEDRSEPGGTNGPPPPDRYRIRIWFVAPDTSDGLTLRQEVACANPITEEVTASTPDIDDGGDLIRGNQQIHPPLNKTCTP